MATTTIQATDGSGSFSAYLLEPKTRPAGVVVLIQEIFGVNQAMRDIAAWVADMHFIAVCPDLFWRIEPGIDITDKSEAEWKRAFELFNAFDVDAGVRDIEATLDLIRADAGCNGKAGAVGFCLGGLLAFLTATRTDADACVSYYGVGLDGRVAEAEKLAHPLLMHIAEEDEYVPKPAQKVILAALKDHPLIELHTYPGCDHAFAREGGQHYDAAAAKLAGGRTLTFFKKALG
jgi:carboxymethylenebutenolidase